MKNEKTRICPECGNTEFGHGKFTGHTSLVAGFLKASTVAADVCLECGLIVNMRVAIKEIFKWTK